MLLKSKAFENPNLRFEQNTVEQFIAHNTNLKWDLIFSNAALQWSDNHETLFPQLISLLSDTGQFAVQMPVQGENLLNKLLISTVQEKPFVDYLKGWKRESPLLSIDQYAELMFRNGLHEIQIIQKVYPIIADTPQKLLDFISGSALIPYLERLTKPEQEQFITEYRGRIEKAFNKFPAIYAFKRLLLYGTKKKSS
jgi:trans-aconitate 2-methyltransferase